MDKLVLTKRYGSPTLKKKSLSHRLIKYSCLPCILTLGLLSTNTLADQIFFKNGDIITGDIIKKETNVLIVKTSYAGEIKIKWSDVSTLVSKKPLKLVFDDGTQLNGWLDKTEEGQVKVLSSKEDQNKKYPVSQLKYVNPSPALTGEGLVWSGHINAGTTFTSGNSETKSARVDAETIGRGLDNRYTFGGFVFWAEDTGNQTANNSRLNAQYDHFFSKHWYGYTNAVFEKDRFRDIKLRSRFGLGSGYQIFESPDLNLAIEGGINYIDQNYYTADDENYAALRWALKYDQKLFKSSTNFFHSHEILYGLKSPAQTLLFTETGLRFPLLFSLNGTAQVNYNWDSEPANGRKKGDTRALFTMGYSW
jgi:putative salt-induced outer membrane protein YdiY